MNALGYCRVSTDQQGADGLGADAQRAQLAACAAQRGWPLIDVLTDVASGKSTNGRHGLAHAIERIERGEAGALIVTKLDRLARSVIDGAEIIRRANKEGWSLVIVELGLDTSTPMGQFGAHILLAAAELERAMISARTRDALAEAKKRGSRIGRPPGTSISDETLATLRRLRREGLSYPAIAAQLDRLGLASPGGKPWHHETVRRAVLAE